MSICIVWKWLQNDQEARATVTFQECNLPPAGSTQVTHTSPALGPKHTFHFISKCWRMDLGTEIYVPNLANVQQMEEVKLHTERTQKDTAECFFFSFQLHSSHGFSTTTIN